MRSHVIVVFGIHPEHASQVTFPEDDDVVASFATDRTDEPLRVAVLPRRSWCSWWVSDSHRQKASLVCIAIGTVAIADQVSCCLIPWKLFGDLPSDPFSGGTSRGVDRDQQSSIKGDDHQGKEHPHSDRRDHE